MGSRRPCAHRSLTSGHSQGRLLSRQKPEPLCGQLGALNGFTSGTFLCLPASRLEVSQGARPRSCSQIPPPHSLGSKSKPATIGCTIGAIWLSSCPGRERSRLTGSRIGHHVTLGGRQSAKCLPWGRKQTLELRTPAPPPPFPEPRGAGHSRPSLCIPGHMGWASFLPALLPGPTFLSNHSPQQTGPLQDRGVQIPSVY